MAPTSSVLCTRVKGTGKQDWGKLVRQMAFPPETQDDVLTLGANRGFSVYEWCIDASFAVHPDFKSHTGCNFVFKNGKGSPISVSAKQKLNTGSSTTAEPVGADQVLPPVS